MTSIYDFTVRTIDGVEQTLDVYKGKTLLIVNTASKCGFTPQYEGLESLYKRFSRSGLEILGFPCNQFANQEPGNESEIKAFCSLNFGVTFPLFSKIDVNGPGTHPLFAYLKDALPGTLGTREIKWNFTKFLIDRDGNPVKRFPSTTTPEKLEKILAKSLRP
jgi:glutathione peroxidase